MADATIPYQRAQHPFQFATHLHLTELTGISASTLPQLIRLLRDMPDSAIYYHTHHFLEKYQLLVPEPPNDFAAWAQRALGDERLAELLASIDTLQFPTMSELRQRLVQTLEDYLEEHPTSRMAYARQGEEFHVLKSVSVILPVTHTAYDLREFREGLRRITIESIYFHLFQARLRLGRTTNDFSAWLEEELVEPELARQFERLDPYTTTLENLRAQMLALVDQRLQQAGARHG